MTEQMMRDVDPARVAASLAAKRQFMAEVDALPETRRCKGAPVNHDGSCFRCGDDQGEYARCSVRAHLVQQVTTHDQQSARLTDARVVERAGLREEHPYNGRTRRRERR
jgi:hypothetical protein